MVDLSTTIGKLHLSSCLLNASGCSCTTSEQLDTLLNTACCGAVVTKSGTWKKQDGHLMPRFKLLPQGSINSMGIPNLGFKFYTQYCNKKQSKPVVQSIYPTSPDELLSMLQYINKFELPTMIEVNLSCPNLIDPDTSTLPQYLDSIKEANSVGKRCIGIKLPAFYLQKDFTKISDWLLQYVDDVGFITCINSVANGLVIDPDMEQTVIHPKGGFGGLGGLYCKPVALANVYNFWLRLGNKIPIIGCGGISTGQDAFEFFLCGATAVQIGTHLLRNGPSCFEKLHSELEDICKSKKYLSIQQFKGKLKVAPPFISSKL